MFGIGFHWDGSLVATGDYGSVVQVWYLRSGKSVCQFLVRFLLVVLVFVVVFVIAVGEYFAGSIDVVHCPSYHLRPCRIMALSIIIYSHI